MSDETAIVPLDERRIDFYGDEIVAFLMRVSNELRIYVPLRPLCYYMDISWPSQRNRVYRDEVLKTCVFVMNTQLPGDTQRRDHVCLPLDMLPGWLFGISTARVKPDLQEKITRYRRECFRVLWEAFKPHMLSHETAIEPMTDSQAMQELQQIAEMGRAITRMAEQQMELQQQQEHLAQRVNKAGQVVKSIQGDVADVQEDVADIQIRLGTVEDKLHPHAYITDEQAAEVSTVVKALAEMLTRQEKGKNHYQGIFAELHRRFGVPSYKHIRQEQYDAVLSFLDDWRNAAVAGQEFPTD
jgi:hypothetical protein